MARGLPWTGSFAIAQDDAKKLDLSRPSSPTPTPSVPPQRDQRIHPRRPAGGYRAGDDRDRHQQRGHGRERGRVGRLHAEEQPLEQLGSPRARPGARRRRPPPRGAIRGRRPSRTPGRGARRGPCARRSPGSAAPRSRRRRRTCRSSRARGRGRRSAARSRTEKRAGAVASSTRRVSVAGRATGRSGSTLFSARLTPSRRASGEIPPAPRRAPRPGACSSAARS